MDKMSRLLKASRSVFCKKFLTNLPFENYIRLHWSKYICNILEILGMRAKIWIKMLLRVAEAGGKF
jgi:hypothetical protein